MWWFYRNMTRPRICRRARLIKPKVAPNLINAAYLKEQSEGLDQALFTFKRQCAYQIWGFNRRRYSRGQI